MDSHQTLIEYPMFCPQDAYDVSVKMAVYQLTAPQDITIRHAVKNLVQQPQKTTDPSRCTGRENPRDVSCPRQVGQLCTCSLC